MPAPGTIVLVDRIEEGFAVCELRDRRPDEEDPEFLTFPVWLFAPELEEGGIYVCTGGNFRLDADATASRRRQIAVLFGSIFDK